MIDGMQVLLAVRTQGRLKTDMVTVHLCASEPTECAMYRTGKWAEPDLWIAPAVNLATLDVRALFGLAVFLRGSYDRVFAFADRALAVGRPRQLHMLPLDRPADDSCCWVADGGNGKWL
ncbi:MAG: hypothetical protein ACRCV9_03600 [Burkholderiaceae bacterium]